MEIVVKIISVGCHCRALGWPDVECGGVVVEGGCGGSLHAVHQPQRLDMW